MRISADLRPSSYKRAITGISKRAQFFGSRRRRQSSGSHSIPPFCYRVLKPRKILAVPHGVAMVGHPRALRVFLVDPSAAHGSHSPLTRTGAEPDLAIPKRCTIPEAHTTVAKSGTSPEGNATVGR